MSQRDTLVGSLNSLNVKLVMGIWMSSHFSLSLCETGILYSHAWLLWGLRDIQRVRCLANCMACNHVFRHVSFNCKWQKSNSDHVNERWSWFGMAFTNQTSLQGWVLQRASSKSWLITSVFKEGGQDYAFSPPLSSTCLFLASFNTDYLHMVDMMATQSLALTASQLTNGTGRRTSLP